MSDRKTEIARKYLLPERPFLHGMASAFDMFGLLSQGRLETMRNRNRSTNLHSDVDG